MRRIVSITIMAVAYIGIYAQSIINIPADQPTIQNGINAAVDGDTVLVQPGTYVENINFRGKNITVASHFLLARDYDHIYNTIIDGGQPNHSDSGSVATFISGEESTSLLCGFTLTNGSGLFVSDQSRGGGILIEDSSPSISNVIVMGNIAESANGAGVFCMGDTCNPIFRNVIITKNDGSGDASTNDGTGGFAVHYGSAPTLINVIITENEGLVSGGMFCNNGNPVLINVTIANNEAYPNAWYSNTAELISWNGSHPELLNTIIWNDSLKKIIVRDNEITISNSNIQGGEAGIMNNGTVNWLEGNINQDPLFVGIGEHPYQIGQDSPCLDAGSPDTTGLNLPEYDLAGGNRIFNERVDMGAYEWNLCAGVYEYQEDSGIKNIEIYPNPSAGVMHLRYSISDTHVIPSGAEGRYPIFELYSIQGVKIRTLLSEVQQPGEHELAFDISSQPAGMYFVRMQIGSQVETEKLILIK